MKLRLDTNALTKTPRMYRILLMLALTAAAFAGVYFVLLVPQFDQKRYLESEYRNTKQELDRLTAIKANFEKSQKEYAQLKETLERVLVQMPEEKDVPNLLRQVSFVGQESKLRVKFFEPKPLQAKEFYMELPIELRYSGGYHNAGFFFDGVRKLDRIIHVANFTLESKMIASKPAMEGTCLAKTYVYNKQMAQEQTKEKPKDVKDDKNAPAPKK
ncbi:MAG TPA: type 4a pilus biogenesis protein PilO [Syntrophorhabdales bacterium]|nr:type 4a pilus biogenesis protein PilO [Syntrophorhabdales bacterium]